VPNYLIMTLIGVFVTQGVTLGVVNDVFNDVGTTGLVTCHAALGQQRCAVLSSRVGNVAVTGLWSTVLVLHCSRTVAGCLHILQARSALPARPSCGLMMTLTSGVLET
jgi:hypothetical protein